MGAHLSISRLCWVREVICYEKGSAQDAHNSGYQGIVEAWNAQCESEDCDVCILHTCTAPKL